MHFPLAFFLLLFLDPITGIFLAEFLIMQSFSLSNVLVTVPEELEASQSV